MCDETLKIKLYSVSETRSREDFPRKLSSEIELISTE